MKRSRVDADEYATNRNRGVSGLQSRLERICIGSISPHTSSLLVPLILFSSTYVISFDVLYICSLKKVTSAMLLMLLSHVYAYHMSLLFSVAVLCIDIIYVSIIIHLQLFGSYLLNQVIWIRPNIDYFVCIIKLLKDRTKIFCRILYY